MTGICPWAFVCSLACAAPAVLKQSLNECTAPLAQALWHCSVAVASVVQQPFLVGSSLCFLYCAGARGSCAEWIALGAGTWTELREHTPCPLLPHLGQCPTPASALRAVCGEGLGCGRQLEVALGEMWLTWVWKGQAAGRQLSALYPQRLDGAGGHEASIEDP